MASGVAALAAGSMAYFPHDSNAASDIKCQRLIIRRGFDGYGRWWRLCEHLAATKGHAVPFKTDEDKLILGQVLGFGGGNFDELITIEDTNGFVDGLLELGLLETDENDMLKNSRMQENSLYFGRQRANGRKGGRPNKSSKTGDE